MCLLIHHHSLAEILEMRKLSNDVIVVLFTIIIKVRGTLLAKNISYSYVSNWTISPIMYRSRSLIYLVVHPSPSLFVHNLIVVFGCHFSVVGTQLYQKICILNKIEYYIYYLLITRLSFFNYRVPFLVSVIIYCSHFRLFFFSVHYQLKNMIK